jgi:prenyltransferase beta subunit
MDFLKAVEFVRKAGTEEEMERLECILEGKKPKARFLERLRRLQNPDGGFPLLREKGKPSTLMDSAVVLVSLEEFNSLKIDIADKIISFFFARQRRDGSWNEDEDIIPYNPPPWMNPKDIRVKVLSTAYTGFWLAKLGYSQDARIKKACDFLIKHQRKNGAFEGFKHTTWIAASLFAMVYGKECNVTEGCLEFLAEIPQDQWVPSQIAWLLWSLISANFKEDNKFVRRFLDLLVKSQNPDGSFASEDGREFAVSTTIEAIKVLKCLK